jgi:hypothetical protein
MREGFFPVTAIAFAFDALGFGMNWSKFSGVEIRNRTDAVISGDRTGGAGLEALSGVGKGIASNHMTWCLI